MDNALLKKLKIKARQTILALNAPEDYEELLGKLPADITMSFNQKQKHDQVHLFAKQKSELEQWQKVALNCLNVNGIIWVAFPKGTSGIQTDLTRDKGWEQWLEIPNLQFLTLVSLNETWSAIAFRLNDENVKLATKRPANKQDMTMAQYIDSKNKKIIVPDDLQQQFYQHKKAETFFNNLAYTHRKEYVVWIVSAKQQITRDRRVQLTIEKLMAGLKNPTIKS